MLILHITYAYPFHSSYRHMAHYNITHIRRQSFYALPSTQWNLLAEPKFSILSKFDAVDDAIDANANIAEAALQTAVEYFGFPPWEPSSPDPPPWKAPPNPTDQGKASSTIRQLYRDWSTEGATERDACYTPIVQTLNTEFAHIPIARRGTIKVLVPGAGLGRLPFEICKAGYAVEGNEISYHQIILSNHILNHTSSAAQYPLYPWALGFSNHLRRSDQLQRVLVPDVHPGTALSEASAGMDVHAFDRLSMSSADFCVAYKEKGHMNVFDAVATVFFIDTAPNFIAYVETVRNCLRDGGLWINLGPLLWHFESDPPGTHGKTHDDAMQKDSSSQILDAAAPHMQENVRENLGIGEAGSVELTDEEVKELLNHFGFRIERETCGTEMGYVQNPQSMLRSLYRPSFWVARKIGEVIH